MKQEIIRIDLDGVNCYLGKEKDSFILFDTGGHMVMDKQFDNRREKLEKELEAKGCTQGNLKLIVLTHGDNDHVANAAFLRDKYKTKIAMHPGDLELVENPVLEKIMESFRYKSLIFKIIFRLMKRLITKVTIKTIEDFDKFKPDIYLNEGDKLLQYGFDGEIIHIPGHTLGSIGIITAEGDLIAGDTFANMKKPDSAPNAYDFKMLKASLNRIREMDITNMYPGHGVPFKKKEMKAE